MRDALRPLTMVAGRQVLEEEVGKAVAGARLALSHERLASRQAASAERGAGEP